MNITDVQHWSYTLNSIITDNKEISKIVYETWTENNGQDDLKREVFENISKSYVNTNHYIITDDHNKEAGVYITYIYVFDTAGNKAVKECRIVINKDNPNISNVNVTNITNDGFTLYCNVSDDDSLDRAEIGIATYNPVTDATNWQERKWENYYFDTNSATIYKRVNINEHNGHIGMYEVAINVFDKNKNFVQYKATDDIKRPLLYVSLNPYYDYSPTSIFEYNGNIYAMYDNALTWTETNTLCQSMGGHLVTITSQGENDEITKHITPEFKVKSGEASKITDINATFSGSVSYTSIPEIFGIQISKTAFDDNSDFIQGISTLVTEKQPQELLH